MEALQPPGTDILFTRLPHGYGTRRRVRDATAMLNSTTNENLNHFVAWANAYCEQHGRADGIPAVNGRIFRLMTLPANPGLVHRSSAGRLDRRSPACRYQRFRISRGSRERTSSCPR